MQVRVHARVRVALVIAALSLCGCDNVYTFDSIAQPGPGPSTVPDVSGLWISDGENTSTTVMRIAGEDYNVDHCRDADVSLLGTMSETQETIGDQLCFVPIAGHVLLQIRSAGQVQLYQPFLFRFDQDSLSFCDVVWQDLLDWAQEHPTESSVQGLDFGSRSRDWGTEVFITSPADALRAYLERIVSDLALRCDAAEDLSPGWIRFKRLTPPRSDEDPGEE
jgi:hypothetical protein